MPSHISTLQGLEDRSQINSEITPHIREPDKAFDDLHERCSEPIMGHVIQHNLHLTPPPNEIESPDYYSGQYCEDKSVGQFNVLSKFPALPASALLRSQFNFPVSD